MKVEGTDCSGLSAVHLAVFGILDEADPRVSFSLTGSTIDEDEVATLGWISSWD